ncbi:MAG: SDR family NAD(P)-dependent oxidoreductase [Actinomycetota bacterium]|nr:SDR family NAD(P)-dependent oxidoreductase [Actinomycetota bacterium]
MTNVDDDTAIAVTGMACRLPGAPDLATYWSNLCAGIDGVQRFDISELRQAGIDESLLQHPSFVPACAPIPDPYAFDERHFGITSGTARELDPQHRVFIECAWTALESSGACARGNASVGVFAGCSDTTYRTARDSWRGQGNSLAADLTSSSDYFATRVAFLLDLQGPAFTVRTACSTSLVAIHLAVQSLLTNECDTAVAGGVAVRHPLHRGHLYEPEGVYSVDGRCRPYDEAGTGIVSGDGAGVVVLRRLADAIQDGDHIHAVVRGSAINNDGARKSSFTAPGVPGQSEVARIALDVAGLDPSDIGYIEGHGTATPLGDPLEIEALSRVWTARRAEDRPILLGSVKSGIGHLDAAAGVAGFIKACLAVEHGRIPATLNYAAPNPHSGLADSAFVVSAETLDWTEVDAPRRASVHSLGLGGTNAHVVLEQAPPVAVTAPEPDGMPVALTLSARRPDALAPYAVAIANEIESSGASPTAVAYTLQSARSEEPYRRVVLGTRRDELVRSLRLASPTPPPVTGTPRLVVVFPGYGKPVSSTLGELGRHLPIVDSTLRAASQHLLSRWQVDLSAVMAGGRRNPPGVLAAIVAQGLAIHAALDAFGAGGDTVLGQSLGEITASAAAGLISLTDALDLAMAREQAVRAVVPSGAAVVGLGIEDLAHRLPSDVEIALVNSPYRCVVSGRTESLQRFVDELTRDDIPVHKLDLISAVHCSLLDPVLDGIADAASHLVLQRPVRELLSTVGPTRMDELVAADPHHWVRHFREPVRFDECLRTAVAEQPGTVVLEVGPSTGLAGAIRETVGEQAQAVVTAARQSNDVSHTDAFVEALGQLWQHGVPVDWTVFPRRASRQVPLPVPPLARTVHTPESPSTPAVQASESAVQPSKVALWSRSWQRIRLDGEGPARSIILITAGDELGQGMASDLRQLGHTVTVTGPEAAPGRCDVMIDARRIDEPDGPSAAASFLALAAATTQESEAPPRLVALTRGAFDIVGDEPARPAAAAVATAALVVAQEQPDLRITCLDLDEWPADIEVINRVLIAEQPGTLLGARRRSIWKPVVEEVAVVRGGPHPAPVGSYVITGGLGRFGRWVGRWLAEHGCRDLYIVCRTSPPDGTTTPAAAALAAMRSAGARVTVLQADLRNRAATFNALDAAQRASADAMTILHLAGEPHADSANAPLGDLADAGIRDACVEQWDAKVCGAQNLLEWVQSHPQTRCVTFSSNAALLGGPSLAAYAAANAGLDALARHARDLHKLRWTSVGWDGWRLPEDPPNRDKDALEQYALRDGEPWAALQAVLGSTSYHLVVAKGDLLHRHRTWVDELGPGFATSPVLPDDSGRDASGAVPDRFGTGDVASSIRKIWAEVVGQAPMNDDADLYKEGGDSLTAMRIRSRIERDLSVRVTLRDVMANRTVTGLADLVGEQVVDSAPLVAPDEHDGVVSGRI